MPVNIFTTLDDPSSDTSIFAFGVNDLGQAVGQFRETRGILHGFLLNGGVFTTIDDPSGVQSVTGGTIASGINGAGQVVGQFRDASNRDHGFLLDGGNFTAIDVPTATSGTRASGINSVGEIVGDFSDGTGTHGFSEAAPAGARRSTIPRPPPAPLHAASTTKNRSLAIILTPPARTASF
jgi:probable HAF family extracellular repeat protein